MPGLITGDFQLLIMSPVTRDSCPTHACPSSTINYPPVNKSTRPGFQSLFSIPQCWGRKNDQTGAARTSRTSHDMTSNHNIWRKFLIEAVSCHVSVRAQKSFLMVQTQRKTGTVGAQCLWCRHTKPYKYTANVHKKKKKTCEANSRRDDMLNYPGDVWLNEPLVLITLRINQQPWTDSLISSMLPW